MVQTKLFSVIRIQSAQLFRTHCEQNQPLGLSPPRLACLGTQPVGRAAAAAQEGPGPWRCHPGVWTWAGRTGSGAELPSLCVLTLPLPPLRSPGKLPRRSVPRFPCLHKEDTNHTCLARDGES